MEALTKKKRLEQRKAAGKLEKKSSRGDSKKAAAPKGGKLDGYDSEDTYNSAEYVRTKEDMDFIDT